MIPEKVDNGWWIGEVPSGYGGKGNVILTRAIIVIRVGGWLIHMMRALYIIQQNTGAGVYLVTLCENFSLWTITRQAKANRQNAKSLPMKDKGIRIFMIILKVFNYNICSNSMVMCLIFDAFGEVLKNFNNQPTILCYLIKFKHISCKLIAIQFIYSTIASKFSNSIESTHGRQL